MPTYEYKCEACGNAFEKFQSIMAPAIKKCPKCGKNKVKRLIGIGSGMIFKGGGFYTTDYRSEAYKSAAKSDVAPSASTDAKSTGDAKTATDSTAKPPATEAKPAAESKPASETKAPEPKAKRSSAKPLKSSKSSKG
ncbi:MAG: zinc ribbon domain-containing protein [Planctomycetota bacterium]|nr:zinc ribbon domain-containing protein [Planctomycetota bacterium]